jgi:hypothetical protein
VTGEPFALVKVKWKIYVGAYVTMPVDVEAIKAWTPPPWPGKVVSTGGAIVHRGVVLPEFIFLKSEADYGKEEESRLIEHAKEECRRVDADISWIGED